MTTGKTTHTTEEGMSKEINPLLALKMHDKAEVLFNVKKDSEVSHLTRAEIDEIIRSMYDMRTTGKLIFHYTGTGIVPEVILKGEAAIKFLTEKKV